MQRRKFLKLFGIGLSAAAIPTAVAAKAALTPPGEPRTAPQPPSGSRPTATATSTNPCGEILADGTYDILPPLSRYFGSSINTRTINLAHHKLITKNPRKSSPSDTPPNMKHQVQCTNK